MLLMGNLTLSMAIFNRKLYPNSQRVHLLDTSAAKNETGLGDGDLLGDFKCVTAHRAKPTSEYNTAAADRTPTIKVFK